MFASPIRSPVGLVFGPSGKVIRNKDHKNLFEDVEEPKSALPIPKLVPATPPDAKIFETAPNGSSPSVPSLS